MRKTEKQGACLVGEKVLNVWQLEFGVQLLDRKQHFPNDMLFWAGRHALLSRNLDEQCLQGREAQQIQKIVLDILSDAQRLTQFILLASEIDDILRVDLSADQEGMLIALRANVPRAVK